MQAGRRLQIRNLKSSHLQDDRQHDGPLAGFLVEVAAQRGADFFLDDAPVADFLEVRFLGGLRILQTNTFDQLVPLVERDEATRDNLRLRLELAGLLVDGEDGDDDAIFRYMAALFQDILFHLVERSDVNVDFADLHPACLLRAPAVEFQNVAGFQDKNFARDGSQFLGDGGVQMELAVISVNGYEVSRANEVQHELQLFNARVSRDVDGRDAAVVVVHASAAAVKVVHHAENG